MFAIQGTKLDKRHEGETLESFLVSAIQICRN
jgi:hypothetical protein